MVLLVGEFYQTHGNVGWTKIKGGQLEIGIEEMEAAQ